MTPHLVFEQSKCGAIRFLSVYFILYIEVEIAASAVGLIKQEG
jgi:hypothetical protein